jgi:hypothetical protein
VNPGGKTNLALASFAAAAVEAALPGLVAIAGTAQAASSPPMAWVNLRRDNCGFMEKLPQITKVSTWYFRQDDSIE